MSVPESPNRPQRWRIIDSGPPIDFTGDEGAWATPAPMPLHQLTLIDRIDANAYSSDAIEASGISRKEWELLSEISRVQHQLEYQPLRWVELLAILKKFGHCPNEVSQM